MKKKIDINKMIKEELLKELNDNLYIVGLIVEQLSKSDRLSVVSMRDEIWFTDKSNGKTLKFRIKNGQKI